MGRNNKLSNIRIRAVIFTDGHTIVKNIMYRMLFLLFLFLLLFLCLFLSAHGILGINILTSIRSWVNISQCLDINMHQHLPRHIPQTPQHYMELYNTLAPYTMNHATGKTFVRSNSIFIILFKNASFIAYTVFTCIYRIFPYTITYYCLFCESNSWLYIPFDSMGRDVCTS